MTDNNVKNQESVRKMAHTMKTVFYLSLVTNMYDIYRFVSSSGEVRQGISIALESTGTMLIKDNKLDSKRSINLRYGLEA